MSSASSGARAFHTANAVGAPLSLNATASKLVNTGGVSTTAGSQLGTFQPQALTLSSMLTESNAAPSSSIISQPLFGGPIDGGHDYSDNNGTPGQTFTTGTAFSLSALTIKGAGSAGGLSDNGGRYFILSISVASGTNSGSLTQIRQEVSQKFNPGSFSSYLTFNLSTPLALSANTVYEYDIFTSDNADPNAHSANGGYYSFAKSTNDVYSGGIALGNGSQSRYSPSNGSIQSPQAGYDRTFFLQGTAIVSSLTWDANTTTGASIENGSGTWTDGGNNWNDGSGNVNWSNANPTSAVFGGSGTTGAAGTVTLGSAIVASGLTFGATDGGNYTLTGNTLTLTGIPSIAATQDATINSVIAGSDPITKTGTATVTLGGSNTFSGQMNVNAGTIRVTDVSALGTTDGGTVVASGAAVDVATGGTVAENFAINGTGAGGTGALVASTTAASTLSGTVALQSDSSIGVTQAGGQMTLGGVVSGAFGLTKVGAGTLTLTGANTYSGATTVNAGSLQLGDGTKDGTIANGSNVAVAANAKLAYNNAGAQTYSGTISGAGVVIKTGAGLQTLSGNSTYSGGTRISAGALGVGSNTALGSGAITLDGGKLQLQGSASAIGVKLGVGGAGAPAVTGTSSYGVIPIVGNKWNNFSGSSSSTPTTLQDSSGMANAATLSSFTSPGLYGTGSSNPLLNGYLDNQNPGGTQNVVISNLSFDNYSVYAYFGSDQGGRSGSVNIGGTTYFYNTRGNVTDYLQTTATADAARQTANYAIFSGLSGNSFTLNQFRGDNNSGLQGLEIVGVANSNLTNDIAVTSNSTVDVTGRSSATVSGVLTIGANTLSVTGGSSGVDAAYNLTLGSIGGVALQGNATFDVANNGAGNGTLVLGALGDGGTSRTITKASAGTLTLNTAAGSLGDGTQVNVTGGTLNSNNATALGSLAAVNISGGATFGVGASQTLGSLAGAGGVNLGANTLTVGSTNNLSSTYSGSITGTGNLIKAGTGMLTLAGANAYTGSTTINGGKLEASANNALGSTSGVAVNGGGTLLLSGGGMLNRVNDTAAISLAGGTVSVAATSQEGMAATAMGGTMAGTSTAGLGALTLTANSTLDFDGASNGNLLVFTSFADPNASTLSITNYINMHLDGTSNSGLASDDRLVFHQDMTNYLTLFDFGSGPGVGVMELALDGGYYEIGAISGVPEPATWLAGGLLAAGAMYSARRKLCSLL